MKSKWKFVLRTKYHINLSLSLFIFLFRMLDALPRKLKLVLFHFSIERTSNPRCFEKQCIEQRTFHREIAIKFFTRCMHYGILQVEIMRVKLYGSGYFPFLFFFSSSPTSFSLFRSSKLQQR